MTETIITKWQERCSNCKLWTRCTKRTGQCAGHAFEINGGKDICYPLTRFKDYCPLHEKKEVEPKRGNCPFCGVN